MKNTLADLNNHLFEALERLNDDLSDEQLDKELKRAEGICAVSEQIIENAALVYKTMVHMDEYGYGERGREKLSAPTLLTGRGGA